MVPLELLQVAKPVEEVAGTAAVTSACRCCHRKLLLQCSQAPHACLIQALLLSQ